MALAEEQYAFWRRRVRQWQDSGLTRSAYAARRQISRAGLCRRQQRLADSPALDAPMTLIPATRLTDTGSMVLRNGPWQLELPAGASAGWPADLLERLSGRPPRSWSSSPSSRSTCAWASTACRA